MAATKRAPQRYKNRNGLYRGAWGRVGRPETYSTGRMIEAIVEAGGRLTRAAEVLGCDSETLRRRALKSAELRRAIALMRSRAAKVTFERQERRRRQRAREEVARREALVAEREYRPTPRVEVVYQEGGLVRREAPPSPEADVSEREAPPVEDTSGLPAGKRHPDLPWAALGWPLLRILAPTADKHHGQLLPGDTVRQPPRVATAWINAGVAELVEFEEDRGGRGPGGRR